MPNWCTNQVDITGSPAELKKFLKLVTKKFNFDKVIPMPKEIVGTRSPVNIVSVHKYKDGVIEISKINDDFKRQEATQELGMTREMSNALIEKYGADNWYDWSIKNWGVKWNSHRTICQSDKNSLSFEFDTAWSAPDKVFNKLKELFPKLDFDWTFEIEGGNPVYSL